MKTSNPEIALLLSILDECYERQAWHGPNLKGSLRGVSAKTAAWRPGSGRHNIWEIALHAAYWKYVVRRRLLGEKRGSFPVNGSNWFLRPDEATETSWKRDRAILEDVHRSLRETIVGLSLRDLKKTPPGSKVSTLRQIYGISMHDVYHAGQIQALKRLAPR